MLVPGCRVAAALPLILAASLAMGATGFAPPPTPARPVVEDVHGVRLTDPYRWLENGKDPEVQAWTRAQHQATVAWLDANVAGNER